MKSRNLLVKNIKRRMIDFDLNQERLAQKINMSKTTLSAKFNNSDTFKVSDLKRISAVLHCELVDLFEEG